jgi:glycosyltransferase involved in cell wall biosynthesis
VCRDLAAALGIEHAVTFLGAQPHDVVERQMRQARAVVQHSVTASNGDSEGTPVAILEAGAMGLPVVATRHAGIPDVVADGATGLLVDERDVRGMARHMLTLARSPSLSGQLGRNAAMRVRSYYTMEQSIGRLARVLRAAAARQGMAGVRAAIERGLPPTLSALEPDHDDRASRDYETREAVPK